MFSQCPSATKQTATMTASCVPVNTYTPTHPSRLVKTVLEDGAQRKERVWD